MEIVNNTNNVTPFENIDVGNVFMFEGIFYMRIFSITDKTLSTFNAIDLTHGSERMFCDDTIVHPVEGKFVIEKIW